MRWWESPIFLNEDCTFIFFQESYKFGGGRGSGHIVRGGVEVCEDIFWEYWDKRGYLFTILRLARIFFLFDIKPFPIPRCLWACRQQQRQQQQRDQQELRCGQGWSRFIQLTGANRYHGDDYCDDHFTLMADYILINRCHYQIILYYIIYLIIGAFLDDHCADGYISPREGRRLWGGMENLTQVVNLPAVTF